MSIETISTTAPNADKENKEKYDYISAGAALLVIGFMMCLGISRILYYMKLYIGVPLIIIFALWLGIICMIIGVALLSKKA